MSYHSVFYKGEGAVDFLFDFEHFVNMHQNSRIGVFFHTSCVLESQLEEKKKKYGDKKYSNKILFYLPGNCVYELKLLKESGSSPGLKKRAVILLNNCGTGNAWFYRDMFSFKGRFLNCYHCDAALFVFYEPAAAASFSESMGKCSYIYILSYDTHHLSSAVINPAIDAGLEIGRPCVPAASSGKKMPDKKGVLFEVRDRNGAARTTIYGKDLEYSNSGGEGVLYTTSAMPGKLNKSSKNGQ